MSQRVVKTLVLKPPILGSRVESLSPFARAVWWRGITKSFLIKMEADDESDSDDSDEERGLSFNPGLVDTSPAIRQHEVV